MSFAIIVGSYDVSPPLLSCNGLSFPFEVILSYLSDLTSVSDRERIDNPFIALVARFLFVCVGVRDSCVASY